MSPLPFLTHLEPDLFKGRDIYAVFGNPIAHSQSPQIHEQFARRSNQDLTYLSIQPEPDQFFTMLSAFFQMGGKGANITVPFKLEAYTQCQQLTPRAKLAGAVNTIWQESGQLVGDNTDGVGLVRDLRSQGIELKNKRILIVGAGGASRGIIGPIAQELPSSLIITNRTVGKAEELVVAFKELTNSIAVDIRAWSLSQLEQENLLPFDLVMNASAAGLDRQSPFSELAAKSVFRPNCFAYDLLYGKTTPFIQQALERGCRVSDGLGMLVEQAAEAFVLWRKLNIELLDTRIILASLRQV
jgi:shikimate dehydrogenase